MQEVYDPLFSSPVDNRFVRELLRCVFAKIAEGLTVIQIGSVTFATPPPNIGTRDVQNSSSFLLILLHFPSSTEVYSYTNWFTTKQEESGLSLESLIGLESEAVLSAERLRAVCMVSALSAMYEAQAVESSNSSPLSQMSMLKLRTVLDFCSERLPPLVASDSDPLDSNFDFAYHCPSALSTATHSQLAGKDSLLPETLAFVADEECVIFNRHMCFVRQFIAGLYRYILSGPQSIPEHLVTPALALEKEQVPQEWQHPTERPCTHSLFSWVQSGFSSACTCTVA